MAIRASPSTQSPRFREAAYLDGASERLRESTGASPPAHRARYDRALETARANLGASAFDGAWQGGHDAQIESIVDAIAGENLASIMPEEATSGDRAASLLTPREIEVLTLLSEGLSNREIGEQLFVSERTAQTHVQHILDKLEVSTRAAAAAVAIERQLI